MSIRTYLLWRNKKNYHIIIIKIILSELFLHMCVGCFRLRDTFVACAEDLTLPNLDLCEDDYIWTAIKNNSWYFSQELNGFDPEECKSKL